MKLQKNIQICWNMQRSIENSSNLQLEQCFFKKQSTAQVEIIYDCTKKRIKVDSCQEPDIKWTITTNCVNQMFNGKINEVMLECHSVSNIIRLCPITKWVTSWTYRYRNSKTRLQGLWTELPSSESIVFNTFSSVPSHCLPSQTQLSRNLLQFLLNMPKKPEYYPWWF